MVDIKYNGKIDEKAILNNLKRITNQVYKLLPSREEGLDWRTPLTTILEELSGMYELFITKQDTLFLLLCKLEGLFLLQDDEDFFSYRRTIFECLYLIDTLSKVFRVAEVG